MLVVKKLRKNLQKNGPKNGATKNFPKISKNFSIFFDEKNYAVKKFSQVITFLTIYGNKHFHEFSVRNFVHFFSFFHDFQNLKNFPIFRSNFVNSTKWVSKIRKKWKKWKFSIFSDNYECEPSWFVFCWSIFSNPNHLW